MAPLLNSCLFYQLLSITAADTGPSSVCPDQRGESIQSELSVAHRTFFSRFWSECVWVCVRSCGTQFSCSGLPASGEMNHSAPRFESLKCPLEVLRSHELPGSARTKAGNSELWLRLTITQSEVSQSSLLNELQPSAFLSYTFWLLTSMQEFSSARQTHTHTHTHHITKNTSHLPHCVPAETETTQLAVPSLCFCCVFTTQRQMVSWHRSTLMSLGGSAGSTFISAVLFQFTTTSRCTHMHTKKRQRGTKNSLTP